MGLALALGVAVGSDGSPGPGGDPSVKLWLRADLGFSGAGWQDQSIGGGLVFSSAHLPTLVASGINGLPTLAGNGTNTSLYNTSYVMPAEEFCIYVVAEEASQATTKCMLSDTGASCALYANSATTVAMFASPDQLSVTYDATAASVYRAVFNSGTSSFRASPGNHNTAGALPASWPGSGGLALFNFTNGSWFWDKWISEVIIRAGAPDANTETYLSARYGITIP